ncbi:MAG: hypothetical protein GY803_14035, partial [Chloroflexi bacterium]|nr:hypothetical protein [Chloroflexota bacterium]
MLTQTYQQIMYFIYGLSAGVPHSLKGRGLARPMQQAVDFDFMSIAIIAGGISLGLIGVAMVGNMIWPDWTQKSKQGLQTLITGFIILTLAST